MAKIRTLSILQDALDSDMGWRIKEISDIKFAAKRPPESARTFIRAGVALVYAHWEGFIKKASENYLNYINNQGYSYSELKTCFAVHGLKGKLETLSVSRNAKLNVETFDFITSQMNEPTNLLIASAINTEANLSSKVFSNIAGSLDISISAYEARFRLIDESLLSRRNKIAHGEFVDLNENEFVSLTDAVLELMRIYKTDIENAATLGSYKKLKVEE